MINVFFNCHLHKWSDCKSKEFSCSFDGVVFHSFGNHSSSHWAICNRDFLFGNTWLSNWVVITMCTPLDFHESLNTHVISHCLAELQNAFCSPERINFQLSVTFGKHQQNIPFKVLKSNCLFWFFHCQFNASMDQWFYKFRLLFSHCFTFSIII